MPLTEVYTLLGLEQDNRVEVIYEMVEKRLMQQLNKQLENVTDVPDELDWIVVEVTLARFRYMGSEGKSSESVEGHSANFHTNMFDPYLPDINDYIMKEKPKEAPHSNTGRAFFA
jgi:hypothetical protein